ncbi:unnamed protein product [Lampetra fluviatilis]
MRNASPRARSRQQETSGKRGSNPAAHYARRRHGRTNSSCANNDRERARGDNTAPRNSAVPGGFWLSLGRQTRAGQQHAHENHSDHRFCQSLQGQSF